MRSLMIEIPGLPPRELSLNSRVHWTKKSEAMREAKLGAYLLICQQWRDGQIPMRMARISYCFHLKSRRVIDYDNLICRCKPYVDAFELAAVIEGDDVWHLDIGSVTFILAKVEKTVISIQERGE